MGERINRNTTTILIISCVIFIMTIIVSCSNPVKPAKWWDIEREDDLIWFVKSNHTTITKQYTSNNYAYVTLLDNRPFGRDTSATLLFTSALGDTEIVNLYQLRLDVPVPAVYLIGGANILLRDGPVPLVGDGALDVGRETTTVNAIYFNQRKNQTLSVIATVGHK